MFSVGALLCAPILFAQGAALPNSAVLTIDSELLFNQSMFGQRIAQDLAAEEAVLLAENRRIQAELVAEEQALTDKRGTLDAKAFRAIAEAFDARVVQIRNEQEEKSAALERQRQTAQDAFVQAADPILKELMREAGARVVHERRAVLFSDPAVDVTGQAILRLNQAIGDGTKSRD